MNTVLDVVAATSMLVGAALVLFAGIGLLRLPDVLSRMQALAKPQGLGLLLLLFGAALRLRTGIDITTITLVAVFQLMTTPVAANIIGAAAYRTVPDCRKSVVLDEFEDEVAAQQDGRDASL